jgi:hypothetical protein
MWADRDLFDDGTMMQELIGVAASVIVAGGIRVESLPAALTPLTGRERRGPGMRGARSWVSRG